VSNLLYERSRKEPYSMSIFGRCVDASEALSNCCSGTRKQLWSMWGKLATDSDTQALFIDDGLAVFFVKRRALGIGKNVQDRFRRAAQLGT